MTQIEEHTSQKVIMLAGAGASDHLGLPSLDDVLQRAVIGNDAVGDLIRKTRNSIESESSRYNKAVFEELIVQLRYYLKITHVLRTDATLRGELPGMPIDIDNGISEMKWKEALTRCYRVMLEEYGPGKVSRNTQEFHATLKLFAELASLNGGTLHVFTTNYDCSYQVLASNCANLRFLTHIDNSSGQFRDQWYSVRPQLDETDLPSVYIHRLHGCVAWFTACPGGDDMGSNCGSIEEVYGAGGTSLTVDDNDYLHRMCIKLVAAQLVGTNPVFRSAFDEFNQHLETSGALFVWGYSFRDLEVMRQIDRAAAARQIPLDVFYLDSYLTEEKVVQNIRTTFHAVPTTVSSDLSPRRVIWRPTDGYSQLGEHVVRALNKENKHVQETI